MTNYELLEITKPLTVLYVEDDEIVAKNMQKILSKLFDNVIYATNGQTGLEQFQSHDIDIIISDINMPELSGINMLKEIKKTNIKVPAMLITAHQELEYYEDAMELNVDAYLNKPINVDKLIEKIKNVAIHIKKTKALDNSYETLTNANQKLLDIGYKITSQKDFTKILETILLGAKELSNSDGGTLYLYNEKDDTLEFKIATNDTLKIHNNNINWKPLNIFNEDKNTINVKNVAVVSAMKDKLINIPDVYKSEEFDFAGAKAFDENQKYQTKSMLVIPMKNKDNELVGVIQLINKLSNGQIISFTNEDEILIKAMASLATMIIENNQLVIDLEALLYGLINSVNKALSEKSKYTQQHNDNVVVLTNIIAAGINNNKTIYPDIEYTDIEMEEIRLSAMLHDIGKITTPVHIMDKATKLETIYDRLHTIKLRFELLKKDIEISFLKNEITEEIKNEKIVELDNDFVLIEKLNNGEYFAKDEEYERVETLAKDSDYTLLTKDELYNLSTRKGTLTAEDREIINNHVVMSYEMIKELPFPKKFKDVPKIACSHHKTIDGGGYASKEIIDLELTLKDKILVIADIFEALSSKDRPYKAPNTLSQIFRIFTFLIKDNKIDRYLVQMFFEDGLYLEYAKEHFEESQMEDIQEDIQKFFN